MMVKLPSQYIQIRAVSKINEDLKSYCLKMVKSFSKKKQTYFSIFSYLLRKDILNKNINYWLHLYRLLFN